MTFIASFLKELLKISKISELFRLKRITKYESVVLLTPKIIMKTLDRKRQFKLDFEKSNLSFAVMIPTTDEFEDIIPKYPEDLP